MPTRKATAVWTGGRDGSGQFTGETGAVNGPYTFGSRFATDPGSNPEELLAAANAACFNMALTGALERNGTPPERVETNAACTVEKVGEGYKITSMMLRTKARVPNLDAAGFQKFAEQAKDGCPVSSAFKGNVRIDLEAALEG